MKCVAGISTCLGPLAPMDKGFVCDECAKEFERQVQAGVIQEEDFYHPALDEDDGDYLDRKLGGR